jgi:hypothetical protein
VTERLDAMLSDAAKKDSTSLDFLDGVLAEELASKPRKRISMHVEIARFPRVKALEDVRPAWARRTSRSDRDARPWRPRIPCSS